MRKISFRGSNSHSKRDDGSVLGLTVLVLLFFVVAAGLLLRASYAEYKKVHEELVSYEAC